MKLKMIREFLDVIGLEDMPQIMDLIEAHEILSHAAFNASQDPYDEELFIIAVNARTYMEACLIQALYNKHSDIITSKWYAPMTLVPEEKEKV